MRSLAKMRASRLPPALRASSTICAVLLLFATSSCVSAESPSTSTTTSHSTTTPSHSPSPSDDHIDPNSISTGNSGLSNGAIAGISACGGIVFVFSIAVALFIWNRRATRDMPDVQELVLSDGDEVQAQRLQPQQRRRMAGPLTTRISDGPCGGGSPLVTPPEAVYRMTKKGSDASEYDLEKGGLDGVRGLRGSGGRDWAEALDGDDEAVLQAAVARVVSGKS